MKKVQELVVSTSVCNTVVILTKRISSPRTVSHCKHFDKNINYKYIIKRNRKDTSTEQRKKDRKEETLHLGKERWGAGYLGQSDFGDSLSRRTSRIRGGIKKF